MNPKTAAVSNHESRKQYYLMGDTTECWIKGKSSGSDEVQVCRAGGSTKGEELSGPVGEGGKVGLCGDLECCPPK